MINERKGIMSAHITTINWLHYNKQKQRCEQVNRTGEIKKKKSGDVMGIRVGKEVSNLHPMSLDQSCKP